MEDNGISDESVEQVGGLNLLMFTWVLVVAPETVKRCLQVLLRYKQQQKRDLQKCISDVLNRGPFSFAFTSIVIIILIFFGMEWGKPSGKLFLPDPDMVIAYFILAGFYVLASLYWRGLFVTPWEKEVILEKSQCDLGPGMAQGFFSYLENGLSDENKETIFAQFIEDQISQTKEKPDCVMFEDKKVFILFPDLTSDYYWNSQVHEIGLLGGLVEHEYKKRKEELENPILELVSGTEYTYTNGGKQRTSHYLVLGMEMQLGMDNVLSKYCFVSDNRPLYGLKRWQLDNDISREEFRRQLDIYENHLLTKLESSSKCVGKFIPLFFDGSLSLALKEWQTQKNKTWTAN